MHAVHRLSAALLTAAALALVVGCATITRGATETFIVETLPGDAVVTTSLGHVCRSSPCAFPNVSRWATFTVHIERPGFHSQTVRIDHHLSGGGAAGLIGNAAIPVIGVVTAVVDANTGATQSLSPNPLRVTLQPVSP